jgi:hypothetical protein
MLKDVYTVQSFISDSIVAQKIENNDFAIQIEKMDDDGEDVLILVDGNHSFEAAKRSGNIDKIEIEFVSNHSNMTLEQYVESFNDLSNPVNVINGIDLW